MFTLVIPWYNFCAVFKLNQYSLVLFTSSTIENMVAFCSFEEQLVKYVGFGSTQKIFILQTCILSYKIAVMCGRKEDCVKGPSQFFIFLVFLPW